MINETVGNYRVVKLLGEGGMGVVYMAEHPGIGRKAAIKVLHPAFAQSPEIVTRFFNEARAANAIRHPGIVEVFDFGTLPTGATYIIMELLAGESLATRLKRVKRLAVGDAVEIAWQIADVLRAAHALGIVHRDLKPDNLFLVPDFRTGRDVVKILDFGIAKLTQDSSASGSLKTRTGTIMGTPIYMSPEQCRGTREVDQRTDIYALGIILYEMLCGAPPFVSAGQGELMHMHIAVPPASPRSHVPAIPRAIEAVILNTLVKDPGERFQTMDDLQRALRDAPLTAPAGVHDATSVAAAPRASSTLAAEGPAVRARPPTAAPIKTTFSDAASMIDEPAPTQARARSPMRLVTLAVAVAVAGTAAAAIFFTRGHAGPPTLTPEAPAAASAAPSAPLPAKAPTPAPPVEAAGPGRLVSVGVTSDPAGARLVRVRDGADIGVTPFHDSRPADDGTEQLRLELNGYRPEPVVMPHDRDVALSFTLTKLPSATHHHTSTHAGAPHGSPARPAAPTPPPRPERPSEPVPL